jgi:hypothetical protein
MNDMDSYINNKMNGIILGWYRYVDDILCFTTPNMEDNILNELNDFNSNIELTIEKENNHTLPFLDILLIKNNNGLVTDVYRKPTNTNQYLAFSSCGPISHKINVVRTLTKRAHTHCSNNILYKQEMNRIYKDLQDRGYTKKFIKNNTFYTNKKKDKETFTRTCYLQYYPGIEPISFILKKYGINTYYKNRPNINNLLNNHKDKTEQINIKDVVYSIKCGDCESIYYGETGRTLGDRIHEHHLAIKRGDEKSLIYQHIKNTKHSKDWNITNIINKNIKNKGERLFLESWHTKTDNNSINRSIDMPIQYLDLIK